MRSTLEKYWELRDYHGSCSTWSSSKLDAKGLAGGLIAFGIQNPQATPTRVIVRKEDLEWSCDLVEREAPHLKVETF
jgi:hypothetical protein